MPWARSAFGSAKDTSAKPPVFMNGCTSVEINKTFIHPSYSAAETAALIIIEKITFCNFLQMAEFIQPSYFLYVTETAAPFSSRSPASAAETAALLIESVFLFDDQREGVVSFQFRSRGDLYILVNDHM